MIMSHFSQFKLQIYEAWAGGLTSTTSCIFMLAFVKALVKNPPFKESSDNGLNYSIQIDCIDGTINYVKCLCSFAIRTILWSHLWKVLKQLGLHRFDFIFQIVPCIMIVIQAVTNHNVCPTQGKWSASIIIALWVSVYSKKIIIMSGVNI